MEPTTIERPVAGDPITWPTQYGPVGGWLIRYFGDGLALCEMKRGGLINVPVDGIVKDAA